MKPLVIWSNHALSDEAARRLVAGCATHRLLLPPARSVPGASRAEFDQSLATADIAFGQPDPAQVIALPNLRWIQLSSAGYTPYDREDLWHALRARGAALTKSSMVHDEPCAEHVLAFMLAHARQLPDAVAAQIGPRTWDTPGIRARSRLLTGQSVVMVGFGSIARRLCQLLAPFAMKIVGVRRRPIGDEPVPMLSTEDPTLPAQLGAADHVIDILPASPHTNLWFGAARLAMLKPGAVFYNIGRGSTVDQVALGARLHEGQLAAAYLDVTVPEPLPPDHPLWSAPRCTITPHTAGGFHDEGVALVQHFLDNLARFADGQALRDRVA